MPTPSFGGASGGALVVVTVALVGGNVVETVALVDGNVVDFRNKLGKQGKDLKALDGAVVDGWRRNKSRETGCLGFAVF